MAPTTYRVTCRHVHPDLLCDEECAAQELDELVARLTSHGRDAHGFTAAFYTPERIELIKAAVLEARSG
jgi:predicted small metal-binding protein